MDWQKLKAPLAITGISIAFFFLLYRLDALLAFLSMAMGIMTPMLVGGAFAFVFSVPINFIERRLLRRMNRGKRLPKLKRPLSMTLVLALTLALVYWLAVLIVPEITNTLALVADAVPGALRRADAFLREKGIDVSAQFFPEAESMLSDPEKLKSQLTSAAQILWNGAMVSTSIISNVFQNVTAVFFSFMFMLYILVSKEKLSTQCRKLLYAYVRADRADRAVAFGRKVYATFATFISGQCLEACILGAMFFISMTLFRMPYALLISVFIAVFSLIPLIGAWIGCITGALLMLISSPITALWFVVLFLVLQQIEGNLIYPQVMGRAIDLPSLWVLFAVLVGQGLMGVVGMLLAIPTASLAVSMLRSRTKERLKARGVSQEKFD